jgi:hypothetical protein
MCSQASIRLATQVSHLPRSPVRVGACWTLLSEDYRVSASAEVALWLCFAFLDALFVLPCCG